MTTETQAQTLARFQQVVSARRTTPEMISLFQKLTESTVFADAHKPACFIHLLSVCVAKVPDSQVFQLLTAVENSKCCQYLYQTYPFDDMEKILGPLVRRVVQATPQTTKDLVALFSRLRVKGINKGRIYSICMLLASGMSIDEVDPICTLTDDEDFYIDHGPQIMLNPVF
ncbi:hypothetical protein [Comamonas thiooxydans]|uniref:hypothetical protein n=1 Tax=Comamonas thiooxydans TaxID=363952 RepID=UPI000B419D10|nr:hypothetical protein [Comamonas thiooxydans]